MKLLRCILLLQFVTTAGFATPPHQGVSAGRPNQPTAMIQSLYTRVIARHPGGIPSGADWKIFAPYMSKMLLHRIADFNACVAEWDRIQDPKHPVKGPFGIFESGIFSGGDEKTAPRSFRIVRTQLQADGSIRVDVRLEWWEDPVGKRDKWHTYADKPYIWHVAAIVLHQDGRYVVDDVIYLKERDGDSDYRLTQGLSSDCNGPHYVGWDHNKNQK
jgi:hypothetical protein